MAITASSSRMAFRPACFEVEALLAMAQTAQQESHPQHQQHVPQDRAGDRGLHQVQQPLTDGHHRDDQLGRVAQRGVQQPANARAGIQRQRLGRFADIASQRDDRQRREDEYPQLAPAQPISQQRCRDRQE